jgi:phage terminase large subunit
MRYGLDFGFNHPTALVQVFIDDKNKKLYLHELLYERGLTNNDLIRCLKNIIPNRNTEIMADSAEPARIEEIYREGFNIHPAVKGQGSVQKSIDKLKEYDVYVTSESANIEKERSKYKWKTDKNNQPLDEPIDLDDDAMAATRYAVNTKEQTFSCEIF